MIRSFWPQSLPRNQNHAEVRIYALLLAVMYLANISETAIYSATVGQSVLYIVSSLVRNQVAVPVFFVGCALLMTPHIFLLLFMPKYLHCVTPRKLACLGAACAAVMWFRLSYLAVSLDLGIVPYLYGARALVNLAFAGVLAFSLNAQQIRPRFDATRPTD